MKSAVQRSLRAENPSIGMIVRDCVTACTCVQKAQVWQGQLADLVGRRPPSLTHLLTQAHRFSRRLHMWSAGATDWVR